MYSYIRGEIAEIYEDSIVLENNGIGYLIFMSAIDLKKLKGQGETKLIHTYFSVSENAVALYGFLSRDEREMFLMLLKVGGIGPKAALSVLSTMDERDLKYAILSDDEKAISKAPGIGAKSAKRIIVELKDKIDDSFLANGLPKAPDEDNERPEGTLSQGSSNDAYLALVSLGYSSSSAYRAISEVEGRENMDVSALLKEALKKLSS